MTITKTALLESFINAGWKKDDAKIHIQENYDFVNRCFNKDQDLSLKQMHKIILSLI